MEHFGPFELFWTIWDHIGSFKTILGCLGLFQPFWCKYSDILGINIVVLCKYSGILGKNGDIFGK